MKKNLKRLYESLVETEKVRRLQKLDEMSVSGIAPVDGTSKGPLVNHNNKFSFKEFSKLRKSKKIKK
jgi:hypothetical protein